MNTTVKTFIFSAATHFSDATAHALQRLLDSTTSIQRFELRNEMNFVGRLFGPIAQAITNSECVSELKFWWVRFQDQSSIAQLQSILQNKRNLTALCLHYCNFGGGQIHEDIISILSRPESLLRCFEFQSHRPLEEAFPGVQFKNLLQAIEKSKLERFTIGTIRPGELQTLTQSIPSMKLKELEVVFRGDEGEFYRETIRQDLLHAVANNFTLLSVKVKSNRHGSFQQQRQAETGILRQPKQVFGSLGWQSRDGGAAEIVARGLAAGRKSWARFFVSRAAFGTWR